MKHTIAFTDLGINRSYKEIWDLQENMLQSKVRQKTERRANESDQNNQTLLSSAAQHQSGFREQSPVIGSSNFTAATEIRQAPTNVSNHLLIVEHAPVYTLGKSGDITHVLISEEERQQKGIEFFKTNRGGDITFHGPGQLVGYPILDLEDFKTDLGWYLRGLEEVVILTIAEYGLQGARSAGETGVWLQPEVKGKERKICAMGIRCSRWVTMHGFALNVNTDLNYFNYIVPCGIHNKQVSSLEKELRRRIDMEEVKQKVKNNFRKIFDIEWEDAALRAEDNNSF